MLATPKACSTHFIETQQEELLYILGINPAEEEEEPQPSQSGDKLGKDQEEKWTFNNSKKSLRENKIFVIFFCVNSNC